jgi:NAD(P)-dependent dehydrogenase (short-subunit alcohol dehydrogenase family)
MNDWTLADLPPQAGRRVIITGATGGIGFEAALALAGAGAEVLLTGRNAGKGQLALQRILARHPQASVRYDHLDLGSLASVAAFCRRQAEAGTAIDLLINNAGVMTPPQRRETEDGFELQFGTNHLAHVALTAQLLPLLRRGRRPQVVCVSSGAHRLRAAIHFDDLQWTRRYQPWPAYAQSKLALLMFALELQRRSDAQGWGLLSNACHPGYARTDLIANGPGTGAAWARLSQRWLGPWMSQSAADGALPALYAATAAQAAPGGYYGPRDMFELKGPPVAAVIGRRARDSAVAARLWEVSSQLTGVQWPAA